MSAGVGRIAGCLLCAGLATAWPLHASASDTGDGSRRAVGASLFVSDDAEDSRVVKQRLQFDLDWDGPDDHAGLELERARFAPLGGERTTSDRAYLRFAGGDGRWQWRGRLGTDGHTWLGNASVFAGTDSRQEYFIEREVVETPMGLARGLHHTFVGAAFDRALDERNVVTALVGIQDFTGDNRRLHLRGRYVHVVSPQDGLSLQARINGFRSSDPDEFDYYSPRWRVEVLPMVQLRRFHGGWQYRIAGGIGMQRDAATAWRRARLVEAFVTSPREGRDWFLELGVVHTNTPTGTGGDYGYTQVQAAWTWAF